MASAPVAATNKLSHRLSTLPVADFSPGSNVKCLDLTPLSDYEKNAYEKNANTSFHFEPGSPID